MKAIRIHGRGGPDHLVYEEAPLPSLGPGEVLVRVAAAAILVNELRWEITYQTASGEPRPLPIPGRDLCGVVAEVGAGVSEVTVGDAVYAMLGYGRDGAEAGYAIALPSELAPKPRTLNDMQAAAAPLSALTAWQALFIHANMSSGQRVLIQGASGGVGTYAVQFTHWAGAQTLATASARNADFLRDLGADVIIDYATTRFEDVAYDVDVVFDLVGPCDARGKRCGLEAFWSLWSPHLQRIRRHDRMCASSTSSSSRVEPNCARSVTCST